MKPKWKKIPNATKAVSQLMELYIQQSGDHETFGICAFMQHEFRNEGLNSYAIIEAFGIEDYIGGMHGVNMKRLEFAKFISEHIEYPGLEFYAKNDEYGFLDMIKLVASSKIPGAKNRRSQILRFSKKISNP